MRQLVWTIGFSAIAAVASAQNNPETQIPIGKATDPVASYGIGHNVGRSMQADGIPLDAEAFVQGLRDGLAGAASKYPEEQVRAAIEALQRHMQAKQQEAAQNASVKNQRDGAAFLAANKDKPGIVTLPSGLQYQVIRAGTGPSPQAADTVKVHYTGTLLDGTVFDSSVERGQPAEFPVNGVIRGWTEALQRMKVGDKWKLFIPADLAYGDRGAGGVIGPGAVLTFDVELLDVKPAAK